MRAFSALGAFVSAFLLVAFAPLFRTTTVLYDGAVGGLPTTQSMTYLTYPPFSSAATQTFVNGATILDTTTQQSDLAGYFAHPPSPIKLDRAAGFSVRFSVQVLTENHANNNRAGCSVIVLSNDKKGIELGFWQNHIWAQEGGSTNLFTHAEDATFDTTVGLTMYDLMIVGDTYTVTVGTTTVLTGPVRDYTAFVGAFNPYSTPDLVFIGDDTTSAMASIKLAYAAVMTNELALALFLPVIVKE